jgi:hypothetical protein
MSSTWTATAAEYNFASDGGSVGTKTLRKQLGIPTDAVITGVVIENLVQPTSGGAATIALGLNTAGDLLPPTAFNDDMWVPSNGPQPQSPIRVKTTAARALIVTIAGAALTAGKFRVHVQYARGTAT